MGEQGRGGGALFLPRYQRNTLLPLSRRPTLTAKPGRPGWRALARASTETRRRTYSIKLPTPPTPTPNKPRAGRGRLQTFKSDLTRRCVLAGTPSSQCGAGLLSSSGPSGGGVSSQAAGLRRDRCALSSFYNCYSLADLRAGGELGTARHAPRHAAGPRALPRARTRVYLV